MCTYIFGEIVEVVNQMYQMNSFSYERPREWIFALSFILLLNGLAMPIPFLLGRMWPECNKQSKLMLTVIDATFDTGYP